MTPRSAWIFAWIWLAISAVTLVLGRPVLAAVGLGLAAIGFWRALRGGGRPWRRGADGRFPQ